jgi:deoxyribodipyrimidine photo-lyase
MKGLVWFRRDLRLRDHTALTQACAECREVVPLFVFDEPLLRRRTFGAACVNFMLGCLDELRQSLAGRGLVLLWRRGDPVEEVLRTVRELGVDAVYWNRDYEPDAVVRDRSVQLRLARDSRTVRTFKDHVVFEAEEVRSLSGDAFQRYGAYRKRWWAKWRTSPPALLGIPKKFDPPARPAAADLDPWPSVEDLGYGRMSPWIVPGERAATARLRQFLSGSIHRYGTGRNRPALDGTSILSPHFRFGTISARTAVHAAMAAFGQGGHVSRPDVLAWIDELVWRDFFQQVLAAFPHVNDGPFRQKAGLPEPRPDGPERDRLWTAWTEGRTGYPIVDAGMRQLKQTGWMHNRVRMVVASFLVKDLRLDWRSGERYFMHHLLDADLAANNGNWQWCASTGTDAMPGYRIFNPALQGKKFDPEGKYVRRYVPELRHVGLRWIHEPHLMPLHEQLRAGCRIGADYPSPIVDHGQARQEYLALGRQEVVRS